jgi:trk system potassium uptake protein
MNERNRPHRPQESGARTVATPGSHHRRDSGGQSHEPSLLLSSPSPSAKRNALTLVAGFTLIILIGTVLLRLPISGTNRALSWSEAFFISTSATTVTGLVVITPALDLSLFGQVVVLLLIEIGGVGFVTFAVVLFALIGRRIGMARRLLLQQSLGVLDNVRITRVALTVLGITIGIQLVGAFLLWLRWWQTLGAGRAAYLALFHSVSAFCNAGFDLFTGYTPEEAFFGFSRDPITLTILMLLIIIGTLGILVITDLVTYYWDRRLMAYTKLVLWVSGVLTVSGFIVMWIAEVIAGTSLADRPGTEQFWVILFNVVSARTAGLAIMPLDSLSPASTLILMVSMFIGGAPASMAGGVTISTVGVLMVAVLSTVRGSPQAVLFGRMLPFETIAKAVAIMSVSTVLCFVVTLILLVRQTDGLFPVGFEAVSAFSNTGYSLGTTLQLDTFGRLAIAFTMFWGRLGPLTMVVLLAQREHPTMARYPAEPIVIG